MTLSTFLTIRDELQKAFEEAKMIHDSTWKAFADVDPDGITERGRGVPSPEQIGAYAAYGAAKKRYEALGAALREMEDAEVTQEELNSIVERHGHWLREDCDGWEDMKANLRGADLRGADLRGADLYRADLREANLRGADLRGVDLSGADLYRADLRGADLFGADLYRANLRGADLRGADLYRADLREAKGLPPIACPDTGAFVAWKKLSGGKIAKLLIPEDAERSSAATRKCRASKAQVLTIYDYDGREIQEGRSMNDFSYFYRVGETVEPDSWDPDRWNECSNGIHFFVTRQEAEEYFI